MPRLKTIAIFAIIFGLMTIVSGGSTLFAGLDMGAVVPFVLWFNFIAGFAYVLAGIGMLAGRPWAAWLAVAIALATLLVACGFAAHVLRGLPFEPRTVGALILRSVLWIWIAYVARGELRRDS